VQGIIAAARLAGARVVVLITLLIVFAWLVATGSRTSWLPYSLDCIADPACWPAPGETNAAFAMAEDYVKSGSRHWFLEVSGQSRPDEPPIVYTHNVNVGGFVIYALHLIGLQPYVDPRPLGIVDSIVLCVGLLYAYLLAKRVTHHTGFSLAFFLLLASDYFFSLAFGLNALRNWHWLALFGAPYHLLRAVEQYPVWQRRHVAGFIACATFGLMIGYDFIAMQGLLCIAIIWLCAQKVTGWRGYGVVLGVIAAAFAVPLLLRQVQVIGYLGWDFWWRDFLYSAAIKTSFLNRFVQVGDLATLDQWYADYHVLRPPAAPQTDSYVNAVTALTMFREIWWPRLGWPAGVLAGVGIVTAVSSLLVQPLARRLATGDVPRPGGLCTLDGPARLIVALLIGELLGIAFFSPLSLHIYLGHAFPAIIAVIHAAQAFCLVAVVALAGGLGAWALPGRDGSVRFLPLGVAVVAAVLLGTLHGSRQVSNAAADPLLTAGMVMDRPWPLPDVQSAACPAGAQGTGDSCRANVEMVPDGEQLAVGYVDALEDVRPEGAMRAFDGSTARVRPGDVIFAGDTYELWRYREDGQFSLLVGTPGRRLTLPALGTLDVATGRFSGLDIVARDRRWVPDLAKLTAFTVQPRFFRISPDGRAPLNWDLNPASTDHRIERQLDDGGPYLRLTFDDNARMFRIYRLEAIPDAMPVPVSVHAEVRASSRGDQELGVAERRAGGRPDPDPDTTTTPATGTWTSLVVNVAATNGSGMPKEIYYALRDAREGDWFDVRRITVFVGIVP
jgi:hypothetical protein